MYDVQTTKRGVDFAANISLLVQGVIVLGSYLYKVSIDEVQSLLVMNHLHRLPEMTSYLIYAYVRRTSHSEGQSSPIS